MNLGILTWSLTLVRFSVELVSVVRECSMPHAPRF